MATELRDRLISLHFSEHNDPVAAANWADDILQLSSEQVAFAEPEKYADIDFVPPKAAQENAAWALEKRRELPPSRKFGLSTQQAGEQGIKSGVSTAALLSSGKPMTSDRVRTMLSYFTRHEGDKDTEAGREGWNKDDPSKGFGAWMLWGGDEGYAWAKRIVAQMDKADESQSFAERQLPDMDSLPGKLNEAQIKYLLQYAVLGELYTDGIDEITRYRIQDGIITGEFRDENRRFEFLVKDGIPEYKALNPAEFEEPLFNFAPAKPRNCVKGTSCGGTCINKNYACKPKNVSKASSGAIAAISKQNNQSSGGSGETPRQKADQLAEDPLYSKYITLLTGRKLSDKAIREQMGMTQDELLSMTNNVRTAIEVRPGQSIRDRLIELYAPPSFLQDFDPTSLVEQLADFGVSPSRLLRFSETVNSGGDIVGELLDYVANYGAIIDRVINWNGLAIGVEHCPGSVRFPGRRSAHRMKSGYGHIRGTRGMGNDGMALDTYLYKGFFSPEPEYSDRIFKIVQLNPETGEYDEDKYMIGYPDMVAAQEAYLEEVRNPAFFGGIHRCDVGSVMPPPKEEDFAEIKVGDRVKWQWGDGYGLGRVVERFDRRVSRTIKETKVVRNGSPENPALLIEQENGDRVLKLLSEVEGTVVFAEPKVPSVDKLPKKLNEAQIKHLLRYGILNELYTDGIDEITSYQIKDGVITGEFRDENRRFEFKILKSGVAEFKALNPAEFTESLFDFAPSKSRNCVKGMPCGNSCIARSKTCRKQLSSGASALSGAIANQPNQSSGGGGDTGAAPTPDTGGEQNQDASSKPESPITVNQQALDDRRNELLNKYGDLVTDAESNVQRILSDDGTAAFIRVGSADTLALITQNGFKNAFELGVTDHQIPHLEDDYLDARRRVEDVTMGISPDTPDGDRPIYSYLGNANDLNGDSHAGPASAYGSIAVQLKPEALERATFTGADSFKSGIASEVLNDGDPPPPNAASLTSSTRHGYNLEDLPDNYPDFMRSNNDRAQLSAAANADNIDELASSLATTGNRYMEAQIHGGVSPQDIAAIHFQPRGMSDRPTPELAQWAKDNGVDLYMNGRQVDPDTIINPPARPPRSQRLNELSDAIANGDVESVNRLASQIYDDAQNVTLNSGERDGVLKYLYQESGYDGLPRVVSESDIDDAIRNGATALVRGVQQADGDNPNQYFDDFTGGDYFTGNGIYGNGTYVSHSGEFNADGSWRGGNSDDQLRGAWDAVASHSYVDVDTVNFRMALRDDARIITASQQSEAIDRFDRSLDDWASTQRQDIISSGTTFTRADVNRFNRSLQSIQADFSAPTVTRTQDRAYNGKPMSEVTVTDSSGNPVSVGRIHSTTDYAGRTRWVYGGDERGINALQINDEFTSAARAATAVRDAYIEREALRRSNLTERPRAGQPDSQTQARLTELEDQVSRTREVLYGDRGSGSSGRFAVIQDVDAVALDNSYESRNFMNLVNRTAVQVQDTPLSWSDGQSNGLAPR